MIKNSKKPIENCWVVCYNDIVRGYIYEKVGCFGRRK